MSGESSKLLGVPRNPEYFTVAAGLLIGLVLIAMAVDTLRRLKTESTEPTAGGQADE